MVYYKFWNPFFLLGLGYFTNINTFKEEGNTEAFCLNSLKQKQLWKLPIMDRLEFPELSLVLYTLISILLLWEEKKKKYYNLDGTWHLYERFWGSGQFIQSLRMSHLQFSTWHCCSNICTWDKLFVGMSLNSVSLDGEDKGQLAGKAYILVCKYRTQGHNDQVAYMW